MPIALLKVLWRVVYSSCTSEDTIAADVFCLAFVEARNSPSSYEPHWGRNLRERRCFCLKTVQGSHVGVKAGQTKSISVSRDLGRGYIKELVKLDCS